MRSCLGLALLPVLAFATPALAGPRDDARSAMGAGAQRFFAGDSRAARIELLNAIKADPDWALPHALQGRIYLALNNGAAAEAELRRAVSGGMAAASVTHLLAHAYLLQGDPVRARDMASKPVASLTAQAYALRIGARAAIALGEEDDAASNLDAALALAPQSSLLWSDIARFRMLTGNMGGAVEAAQRASLLNPVNVEALILTGQLVRGQYGLLAAIPWFDKALEIDPANIAAMAQAAATLGEAGQNKAMLALTRKMLTIDPGNAQALYLQAVLAARAGNDSLARGLVYRIGGRMAAVPGMMLLESVLEMKNGNFEQAIVRLEKLLKAQPANMTVRRLLGAALSKAGDTRSAVAVLEPLAWRADADGYALALIGRALEAEGSHVAAAGFLDRASNPMRGEPGVFDMGFGLAPSGPGDANSADTAIPRIRHMVLAGELGPALAAAERLRSANRVAPAAHVLVGDVLMAMSRPADAANAYRDAANIQFSEPTAMRFVAALHKSGQGVAALSVLQLFLGQNPRSVRAQRLAAEHHMTGGRWNSAIAIFENLRLRLGNRDATLLANLGWAWFRRGDTGRALAYAGAAYMLAPSNPAVAKGYGLILVQSGKDKAGGAALLKKAERLPVAN